LALALVLMTAALYAGPLRDFFVQQDRYQRAQAAYSTARADNRELKAEAARLETDTYIAQKAREDLQMVPDGMQAFVVKGLPGEDASTSAATVRHEVQAASLTPFERLQDLWETLFE
jgi:hypothetical protein